MRQIIVSAVLFGLASTLFNHLSAQQTLPPVPPQEQLATGWCWAASAQMAMLALKAKNSEVCQVIQAGRRYPPSGDCYSFACAGGTTSPTCNFGGFPQFEKFGFDAEVTPIYRPLKWPELQTELGCRPVVFARENLDQDGMRTGTGHMMVATAAKVVDHTPWIAINDPGPLCEGSMRSETYDQYLGGTHQAHWIDYYSLHKSELPLVPCKQAEPEAIDIRENDSPSALVAQFIQAINSDQTQRSTWIRESSGLARDSTLGCDLESEISQKTISISRLRLAPPGSRIGPLLVDIGRHRFLCSSGLGKSFSVEVERRPSGMWRVATIGDVRLATSLRAIRVDHAGQKIEEVFVQGLNVRFAWLPGDQLGTAIPLSSVPGYEISPASQSEETLLNKLKAAAASFQVTGPT